jgi:hypothetical protein
MVAQARASRYCHKGEKPAPRGGTATFLKENLSAVFTLSADNRRL